MRGDEDAAGSAWVRQLLALNAAAKKVRSSAVAEIPPVSTQPTGSGTTAVIAQSLVRRTCSWIWRAATSVVT